MTDHAGRVRPKTDSAGCPPARQAIGSDSQSTHAVAVENHPNKDRDRPKQRWRVDHKPTHNLPVLPLRDIVVFPHMIVPLFVGRERSVHALEEVMADNKQILLLTQVDASTEDPEANEMFKTGTVGNILQLLKLPDGTVKVLVEGIARAQVENLYDSGDFLTANVSEFADPNITDPELVALGRATVQQFEHYIKLNKKIASEVMVSVNQLEETGKIADTFASHLAVKIHEKQTLLEMISVQERLETILKDAP